MEKKYTFVLDCDGVFTDGTFHYNSEGKCEKVFGPDDADALKLIKDQVNIVICSADHRGFPITQKRINDMGFELTCVKSKDRLQWIKDNCQGTEVAYMGDSFQDAPIFVIGEWALDNRIRLLPSVFLIHGLPRHCAPPQNNLR